MLEKLEISVVTYDDVNQDNSLFRIDPEYFQKKYLAVLNFTSGFRPLEEYVESGYRVVYENTEIINSRTAISKEPYFLQATDLDTPFIDDQNLFRVQESDWDRYPQGRIKPGELLIEVKGKAEKVALVPVDFPPRTLVSGSLYKMTINDKISKYTLIAYLTSKYGESLKNRAKTNLLIAFISKYELSHLS